MNTRPLAPAESRTLAAFHEYGVRTCLLFVTATGLGKSILDATDPMRRLFAESGFHDYGEQPQGQDHKVVRHGLILSGRDRTPVEVSIYRPRTKQGDPRLWPYRLKEHAGADDVLAVAVAGDRLLFLNLTTTNEEFIRGEGIHTQLLASLFAPQLAASSELLAILRGIAARGPLPAIGDASNTIGMTLEHAIGIRANSSRAPDFKGIEIKAARAPSGAQDNRSTLFACVPDWHLSALKSSREILETFGYDRGEDFKLYCTVSTQRANSQGLIFRLEEAKRWLKENLQSKGREDNVAVWRMDRLEGRLLDKHRETFWIQARSTNVAGREHFKLTSVVHTTNPNPLQFGRLLGDGSITMDHLIKRTVAGRVSEKGPLFKIEKQRIPELFFGEPRKYDLRV